MPSPSHTKQSEEQKNIPQELCSCGRDAETVHCPACGRIDIYAYAARCLVVRRHGKRTMLRTYRCRVCGEMFNDEDWQLRCHAPKRRINQHDKPQTPEEAADRLREFQDLTTLKKLM